MLTRLQYRLSHWLFQWNAEAEEHGGSIIFTMFGCIHFRKYKEHTLIYFGQGNKGDHDFSVHPARKYVEAFQPAAITSGPTPLHKTGTGFERDLESVVYRMVWDENGIYLGQYRVTDTTKFPLPEHGKVIYCRVTDLPTYDYLNLTPAEMQSAQPTSNVASGIHLCRS